MTTSGQVTIEKTPSYYVTRLAPARVHAMSPDTRLIVVVRDPVTRAISDYAQAVAKRPDLPPFDRMAFLNTDNDRLRGGGGGKYQIYHHHNCDQVARQPVIFFVRSPVPDLGILSRPV